MTKLSSISCLDTTVLQQNLSCAYVFSVTSGTVMLEKYMAKVVDEDSVCALQKQPMKRK